MRVGWYESETVPCWIIRGGTSKGVFFKENDLPEALDVKEKIILRAFGNPDQRQIDGLGGANSLTSKVSIVGVSSDKENADVDYTFGQVVLGKSKIDWVGNCGNLSSGVALFAVDEGLVKVVEPYTTVRIYNTNTRKFIIAKVPVKNGKAMTEGDYSIAGVLGNGARIDLEFIRPGGSVTGKMLPTGNVKDIVKLSDGREVLVSIVDAANPVVFLKASDLGLEGVELPVNVEQMPAVLERLEEIRSRAAAMLGLVGDWKEATAKVPAIPKIGFVSPAKDYVNSEGEIVKKEQMHFVARLASVQKMHRAYMVTGAVCTGVAANIAGTVVNELIPADADMEKINIGQPYGITDVRVKMEEIGGERLPYSATIGRTARKIMNGYVHL